MAVRIDLARPVARLRRLPAPAVDAGIAAVYVAVVAVEWTLDPPAPDRPALSVLLTLLQAGALVVRRRLPLAAFLTGTGALVVESLFDVRSAVSPYADQLLAFSLGLYGSRVRARWGPPVIAAGVLVYFADTLGTESFQAVATLFIWIFTWAIGYSMARRREDQDRAREAARRQVIAEERTRMARELHDVVAHHVSVVGVLAAAAKRQLDRDPAGAAAVLTSIEDSSRQAVGEMHRMLGFLRDEGETPGLAPPPTLRRLESLTTQLSAAKLAVDVRVEGVERPLPTTIDLAAYRVVQEALTNTVKHAAASRADVHIRYRPEEVEVEILDDGRAQPVAPADRALAGSRRDPGGHGLLGMRERVALHGGRLTAGARPEGGFAVRATFPLDGSP